MKEKLMKRIFLVFVIVIIIVAIVIVKKQGENKPQQTTQIVEEKQYKTQLRIGISALDTFDPILSKNKNVQDICKLIYEPLLTIDEKFKIRSSLAEEWAKTGENSYIVKLKSGVKWHNGNEFTATDVKFTINKIKQENIKSIYSQNVKNISNVTIIDNYTVKFDLLEEEPFFEYNLIFPIECESDYRNSNTVIPSGTGKYKINQINANQMELATNPYNENVENMQMKSIIIKNYDTAGELYNDFKIGNIDLINTDNKDYSNYIGTLGYTTQSFFGRKFNFLSINTKNSALYNIEVRRAISYAIDKNSIISSIYNNKYYVADYPLDYGNWLYNDASTSSGYNPEQSEKILKDSGWEYKNKIWQKRIDNKNLQLKFNLIVSSANPLRIEVAKNIKQQLENVGIQINIVEVESIVPYLENKSYDIALVEMDTGISPDLSIFFGENNIGNYGNQEVIKIVEEVREIKDDSLLKEKYNRLVDIYKIDIPYISLYFNSSILIYNSKMTGTITPTWYNLYYNIENWKIEV